MALSQNISFNLTEIKSEIILTIILLPPFILNISFFATLYSYIIFQIAYIFNFICQWHIGIILVVIKDMRALLVGVTTKYDRYDIDYSLDELKNLAKSLDYEVVGKITQSLDVPNPATYIGKGKLQEIILNILFYSSNFNLKNL